MKARKRIESILFAAGKVSDVIRSVQGADHNICLLDVGADHGWVDFFALKTGIADKCILSDISSQSLEKARKIFSLNPHLKDAVEFRVGDGLEVLNKSSDGVDICVIAGMGVDEILKIVGSKKACGRGVDVFVLQARHDEDFAVKLSEKCGLEVVFDKVVLDKGHVYRTIVAIDFANSALQRHGVCDKMRTAFDEANGKDISNLGIDFDMFGKNNLFDGSKEHMDALEFMISSNRSLKAKVEAFGGHSNENTEFIRELDKRISCLEKIMAFIKEQEPKGDFLCR